MQKISGEKINKNYCYCLIRLHCVYFAFIGIILTLLSPKFVQAKETGAIFPDGRLICRATQVYLSNDPQRIFIGSSQALINPMTTFNRQATLDMITLVEEKISSSQPVSGEVSSFEERPSDQIAIMTGTSLSVFPVDEASTVFDAWIKRAFDPGKFVSPPGGSEIFVNFPLLPSGYSGTPLLAKQIRDSAAELENLNGNNFKADVAVNFLNSITVHRQSLLGIGSDLDGRMTVAARPHINLPLPRAMDILSFPDLRVETLRNLDLLVHGQGVIALGDQTGHFKVIDTPPYTRLAHTQRRLNGFFFYDPRAIYSYGITDTTLTKSLNTLVEQWTSRGWFLSSASIDPVERRAALLMRNAESQNDVALINYKKGDHLAYRCLSLDRAPNQDKTFLNLGQGYVERFSTSYPIGSKVLKAPEVPSIVTKYSVLNENEWPLITWTFTESPTPRGTWIRFNGGPSGNLFQSEDLLDSLQRRLLKSGWRVIIVEVSGATAIHPAITERLSKLGIAKTSKKDSKNFAEWYKAQGFKGPVVLEGESFAASIVAQTIRLLSTEIDHVVLRVPVLELRMPSDVSRNQSTFMTFERFGLQARDLQRRRHLMQSIIDLDPRKPTRFKAEAYRQICGFNNKTLVFASLDYASMPDDWTRACGTADNQTILETSVDHVLPARIDDYVAKLADSILSLNTQPYIDRRRDTRK